MTYLYRNTHLHKGREVLVEPNHVTSYDKSAAYVRLKDDDGPGPFSSVGAWLTAKEARDVAAALNQLADEWDEANPRVYSEDDLKPGVVIMNSDTLFTWSVTIKAHPDPHRELVVAKHSGCADPQIYSTATVINNLNIGRWTIVGGEE